MKIVKVVLGLLFLVFIIAQFFGPSRNNGHVATTNPFLRETVPPSNVTSILRTACFNCHSGNTRYPWYNNVTPINYWMAGHINQGKEHLNFSEWENYTNRKKDHKLEELIEMVSQKSMPLQSYTWMHKEAELSDVEIQALVDWANNLKKTYQSN